MSSEYWFCRRRDAWQAVLFGEVNELGHAPGRFVRHAHTAHLAGLDQSGQRFQLRANGRAVAVFRRFEVDTAEERRVAHRPVDLVQVDHVGFQACERIVAGLHEVGRRHIGLAAAHPVHAARRPGDLARQHDALARAGTGLEPVAEKTFGGTVGLAPRRHRVHLGGVDEIDAAFERAVENAKRGGFVDLFAESHGAQANRRHAQFAAAERDEGQAGCHAPEV